MDLSQSFANADTGADSTMGPGSEDLLLVDTASNVESTGHRVDMPVLHCRTRRADGTLRHLQIEGFRPYFYIRMDEFRSNPLNVLNDRRVLGAEGNFDPDEWADEFGTEAETEHDVAQRLTDASSSLVFHVEDVAESLYEESLVRVIVTKPADIRGKDGLRHHFDETLEADIPFERRFKIDADITRGISAPVGTDRLRYENWQGESEGPTLVQEVDPATPAEATRARVCTVDIEVTTDGEFPEPYRAKNPITAIGAHDNYRDEYQLWGLIHPEWGDLEDFVDEDGALDVDTMTSAVRDELEDRFDLTLAETAVNLYSQETELLEAFHEWFLGCDSDFITGWNSSGFDVPYLIQRSYAVNALAIRNWSTVGKPGTWPEERNGDMVTKFRLDGRVTLDMLNAYRKTQFRDLTSYKLDDVAKAELGRGKVGLAGDELDEAWRDTPVEFFVYNLRDVEAVVEIERETALISLYENLREVTGASYETCNHNGPMIDTLFLREAFKQGIALPSNERPDIGDYHGAHVFTPVPGKHENVVYPDLASLYPYLMRTLNISPETVYDTVAEAEADGFSEDELFHAYIDRRDFATVAKGERIDHIDQTQYKGVMTPDGSLREMFDPQFDDVYYVKTNTKEGFIASAIDRLVELKYRYKEDKGMYGAVKRVTNSCFTPDTEVLTPEGIKNICDVEVGDQVYSLNTETREMEIKPVTETIHRPDYDGELYHLDTTVYNLKVTPDHRMYVRNPDYDPEKSAGDVVNTAGGEEDDGEWIIDEISNLSPNQSYRLPHDWSSNLGEDVDELDLAVLVDANMDTIETVAGAYTDYEVRVEVEYHTVRKEYPSLQSSTSTVTDVETETAIVSLEEYVRNKSDVMELGDAVNVSIRAVGADAWMPAIVDSSDFVELMAWYIALGTAKIAKGSPRVEFDRATNCFSTSIIELIENFGLRALPFGMHTSVTSTVFHALLPALCGTEADKDERLPAFFWHMSVEYKQRFFDTLIDVQNGVASNATGAWSHVITASDTLRDDMVRLGFEIGLSTLYEDFKGDWRIRFCDDVKSFRVRRNIKKEQATDGVYCIQVQDNHMLVAGRNGTFQNVPNCYGVLGDSASGGVGFRLFDWRLAETITLAGQKVIQYTADKYVELLNERAEAEGYEPSAYLVGGDTDSVQTSIPSAPDYATALEWSQDASAAFQPTLDDEDLIVDAGLYDLFMEEDFNVVIGEDEHLMDVEIESLASALFFMRDGKADDPELEAVKKRYAQHMVWDDGGGWLDIDDDEYDAISDPDDLSELKYLSQVTFEDYASPDGVLADQDPASNIGIKGFEYVRSDSAQVTRDAQLHVLSDILLSDDPRSRIEPYIRSLTDDITAGKVGLDILASPKGVNNSLDSYGWKDISELDEDDITDEVELDGGKYTATPGPTYRGAKYADDHFPWEELGPGSKPFAIPIDKVRSDDYPATYEYMTYPKDRNLPDSPEVGRLVDAISVEIVDRLPDDFVVDYDTIIEKTLEKKLTPILETVGLGWDELLMDGQQATFDAWGDD